MVRNRNDSGQALVLFALAMVVVLASLGLGLDLGYLRVMRRQVQRAADAGALAGAVEVSYCSGTSNCATLQKAAQDALTENGMTSSTLATQCNSATGNLIVTVNNPPCSLGSNDPHNGNAKYVEVVVSQVEPLLFAKIFGVKNSTITARAEAAAGNSTNCMYVLSPASPDAVSVTNGSTLSLPACNMYVDSSNTTAVLVSGGSKLTASSISIVGNYSVNGGSTISPTPATGVSSIANPLSYLTPPTLGTCAAVPQPYTIGGGITTTILPGTYCKGISIGNGATVTFSPGTYIMEGGGLTIGGGAIVTGTGITVYLTGTSTYPYGPLNTGNGATVQFTAPTSGTYAGILFYQDPNAYGAASPSTSTFTGGSNSYFQGALYFPTTYISYSGGTQAQYTVIVALSVTVSGGATLNSDYSSLSSGSPIKGTGAVVVE